MHDEYSSNEKGGIKTEEINFTEKEVIITKYSVRLVTGFRHSIDPQKALKGGRYEKSKHPLSRHVFDAFPWRHGTG